MLLDKTGIISSQTTGTILFSSYTRTHAEGSIDCLYFSNAHASGAYRKNGHKLPQTYSARGKHPWTFAHSQVRLEVIAGILSVPWYTTRVRETDMDICIRTITLCSAFIPQSSIRYNLSSSPRSSAETFPKYVFVDSPHSPSSMQNKAERHVFFAAIKTFLKAIKTVLKAINPTFK